ncbi:hypothetical protein ACFFMN_00230 [Planobispora siamensis]|uniref:Uncharacterized protein n=1 Tax=Planobispora siamensis TaxID=936338 RepID=A0A8J3SIW7_9ACTN|nr:hypothetical protein [Planobispora siamensis]GIH93235.1 hypothetical protein Psi01_38650 [Planobispora siamensis]
MNTDMILRYALARHSERIAEAGRSRTLARRGPGRRRSPDLLRHRLAVLLHTLAEAVDVPSRPSYSAHRPSRAS